MNERIVIGALSGLVVSVAVWVWNSDFFSKTQKVIIFCSLLFPPGALGVILIISLYNKFVKTNIQIVTSPKSSVQAEKPMDINSLNDSIKKVEELKSKGVFTNEEADLKITELQEQLSAAKKRNNIEQLETRVKETEEYKSLELLLSTGVLSREEFESKKKKLIDSLKSSQSNSNSFPSSPLTPTESEHQRPKVDRNTQKANDFWFTLTMILIFLTISAFGIIKFISSN